MSNKHIKDISGLDHDFCRICGYVPTEHYLNYLQGLIDKLVARNRKEDTTELKDLRKLLLLAKAKHENHQWSEP
jgi:hypothetical protein